MELARIDPIPTSQDPRQQNLFGPDTIEPPQTAEMARDKALDKIHAPNLTQRLESVLSGFSGLVLTGEQIRVMSGLKGYHPNAWGASINALIRKGRLEPTGEYVKPTNRRSHARKIQLHRVMP